MLDPQIATKLLDVSILIPHLKEIQSLVIRAPALLSHVTAQCRAALSRLDNAEPLLRMYAACLVVQLLELARQLPHAVDTTVARIRVALANASSAPQREEQVLAFLSGPYGNTQLAGGPPISMVTARLDKVLQHSVTAAVRLLEPMLFAFMHEKESGIAQTPHGRIVPRSPVSSVGGLPPLSHSLDTFFVPGLSAAAASQRLGMVFFKQQRSPIARFQDDGFLGVNPQARIAMAHVQLLGAGELLSNVEQDMLDLSERVESLTRSKHRVAQALQDVALGRAPVPDLVESLRSLPILLIDAVDVACYAVSSSREMLSSTLRRSESPKHLLSPSVGRGSRLAAPHRAHVLSVLARSVCAHARSMVSQYRLLAANTKASVSRATTQCSDSTPVAREALLDTFKAAMRMPVDVWLGGAGKLPSGSGELASLLPISSARAASGNSPSSATAASVLQDAVNTVTPASGVHSLLVVINRVEAGVEDTLADAMDKAKALKEPMPVSYVLSGLMQAAVDAATEVSRVTSATVEQTSSVMRHRQFVSRGGRCGKCCSTVNGRRIRAILGSLVWNVVSGLIGLIPLAVNVVMLSAAVPQSPNISVVEYTVEKTFPAAIAWLALHLLAFAKWVVQIAAFWTAIPWNCGGVLHLYALLSVFVGYLVLSVASRRRLVISCAVGMAAWENRLVLPYCLRPVQGIVRAVAHGLVEVTNLVVLYVLQLVVFGLVSTPLHMMYFGTRSCTSPDSFVVNSGVGVALGVVANIATALLLVFDYAGRPWLAINASLAPEVARQISTSFRISRRHLVSPSSGSRFLGRNAVSAEDMLERLYTASKRLIRSVIGLWVRARLLGVWFLRATNGVMYRHVKW